MAGLRVSGVRCRDIEPARAWIAMVATVLINLLLNLSDSFGVYYNALVEKYDASRAAVGWVYSIFWIFIFVAGIFISPFIKRYGCRPVAMTLAFICGVATSLSAFAPSVGSLYFIYSMMTGTACSGIFLASVTAIQQLFGKNRGLATGVAALGFPIGIIIHPLHAQLFLDLYGVNGVFLMHGAISLHAIIFAFALKTPVVEHAKGNATNRDAMNDVNAVNDANDEIRCENDKVNTKRALSDGELPSSNSIIAKCHALKQYFRDVLDFSLLKSGLFILTAIHYLLLWQIRLGVLTQIANCAKSRGIAEHEASYLVSISGMANLATTVMCAIIMNMPWLNPTVFSGFASLCVASAAFGVAFSRSFEAFAGSAVVLGVADSIGAANLPLLVLYTVGLERFTRGFSLLWTMLVLSAVGSSAFVGWMVDMLNSYVAAFIVLGILGIISWLLTIVIVEIRKTRKIKELKKSKEDTDNEC